MHLYLLLHIVGVVLFLGNIVTAAFWKVRADLQGNAAVIHQTAKNVMLADWVFTLPGLALIIVSGGLMAAEAGYALSGTDWLTFSLVLFGVTGVIWLAVLLPMQRAMIRHSAAALTDGKIPEAYRQASRRWNAFGVAATLIPVVILYLMVFKPY